MNPRRQPGLSRTCLPQCNKTMSNKHDSGRLRITTFVLDVCPLITPIVIDSRWSDIEKVTLSRSFGISIPVAASDARLYEPFWRISLSAFPINSAEILHSPVRLQSHKVLPLFRGLWLIVWEVETTRERLGIVELRGQLRPLDNNWRGDLSFN